MATKTEEFLTKYGSETAGIIVRKGIRDAHHAPLGLPPLTDSTKAMVDDLLTDLRAMLRELQGRT